MRQIFLPTVFAITFPILLFAQNSKPPHMSARSKGTGARQSSNDFYATVEKHLVRIVLLILMLFAGYKLIVIEAPRIEPARKIAVPCLRERTARHRTTHRKRHRLTDY